MKTLRLSVWLALALTAAAPLPPTWAANADDIAAMQKWQPAAEAGDAEAQFQLGQMYALGKGYSQSFDNAFAWYEKAAQQGNAKARTALGLLYHYGYGVKQKDDNQARQWWEKAAAQKEAFAEQYLGFLAAENKDYKQAREWLEQAGKQGRVRQ
ncbi:MAG: tetratricopeptide repeat protein [Cardiobacterium sp.]|jgi:hypothetical protein